jgi:hypothetical protein
MPPPSWVLPKGAPPCRHATGTTQHRAKLPPTGAAPAPVRKYGLTPVQGCLRVGNGVSPWIVARPSFGEPTGFTRTGHLRRPPEAPIPRPLQGRNAGSQETQGFTLGCITTPPWGFQKRPFDPFDPFDPFGPNNPNNPIQNGVSKGRPPKVFHGGRPAKE